MTFAVLSLVILSFGAAGIVSFTAAKKFGLEGKDPWNAVAHFAALYAVSLCLTIPLFCWWPISPYAHGGWELMRQIFCLPVLIFILAIPFFFSGICISQTLALSRRPVTIIYFYDLLAAAIGAISCPFLLSWAGGYGAIAIAAFLGLIAALGYWQCSIDRKWGTQLAFVLATAFSMGYCLYYPVSAMQQYGVDIDACKDLALQECPIFKDFGGIDFTHWNAVARVDVSKTGTSEHEAFLYGLPPLPKQQKVIGRFIMLDGGANTRQFKAVGKLSDQSFLSRALWAAPYVVNPLCQNALVIGGGGGIDILVAKISHVPHLDVAEMNPAIFNILTGKWDDPENSYSTWLKTDANTSVNVFNEEARHFVSAQKPRQYDVIQASGVDTLTAIQTGGMSLVENYLYTVEAVRDYARTLKPGGLLSLTHWRTTNAGTSTRMFLTYLTYLDSVGVSEPWKQIVVVGNPHWTDSLLKTTPFTEEELIRLRNWAKLSHLTMIFDPERRDATAPDLSASERLYPEVAFVNGKNRTELIRKNAKLPFPVWDDKPYFYQFREDANSFISINRSSMPISLMLATLLFSIILLIIPANKVKKEGKLTAPVCYCATYFAVCGFAFLLYETAVIQLFSIFSGGPMYSLTVVLVAILSGYSLGSLVASKLKLSSKSFMIFALVLPIMFIALYFGIPQVVASLLPLALAQRLIVCATITLISATAVGLTISSAMSVVKEFYGGMVSWMWGISSIFNALGAMCFVAITQITGISSCLIVVAIMYALANISFAFWGPLKEKVYPRIPLRSKGVHSPVQPIRS